MKELGVVNLFQKIPWRVSRKITACFTLLVVLIFSSSIIVFLSILTLEDHALREGQKSVELVDAQALVKNVEEELKSFTGAVYLAQLRGVDSLGFYSLSTNSSQDNMQRLKNDAPEQLANKDSLLSQLNTNYTQLFQVYNNVIKLLSSGDIEQANKVWRDNLALRTSVLSLSEKLNKQLGDEKNQLIEERNSASTFTKITAITVGLLSILLAAFLAWLLSKTIGSSLSKIHRYLETMSNGDLSKPLEINNRDELGELAKALNLSVKTVRGVIESFDIGAQITEMSKDLKQVSGKQATNAVEQVSYVSQISTSIGELNVTASTIADSAALVADSAEETLQSVEQVTVTTSEVSEVVEQLKQAIDASAVGLEKAVTDFNYLIAQLREVDRQSQSTETVVSLITGIAKETHLLSLNAAIEAAGAGEFGERFKVVARQIKDLASRSAQAAETVSALITDTRNCIQNAQNEAQQRQENMQDAVLLSSKVNEVGQETFQKVEANQALIAAIHTAAKMSTLQAQQIKIATHQQQAASQQILETTDFINKVANSGARSSDEIATTSAQLDGMSHSLAARLAELKLPLTGNLVTAG